MTVDSFPNVLCVGRPRFLKGIHVLARAIPDRSGKDVPKRRSHLFPLRWAKVAVRRPTPTARSSENLLDDPRIRIVADPVTRANMPDYYQRATICVVPSLWEGFGYVCAEAMACGVAVVASRTGGLAEIIEDEQSGVLVRARQRERFS